MKQKIFWNFRFFDDDKIFFRKIQLEFQNFKFWKFEFYFLKKYFSIIKKWKFSKYFLFHQNRCLGPLAHQIWALNSQYLATDTAKFRLLMWIFENHNLPKKSQSIQELLTEYKNIEYSRRYRVSKNSQIRQDSSGISRIFRRSFGFIQRKDSLLIWYFFWEL